MKFDVSERIQTKKTKGEIFESLENQFRNISKTTARNTDNLTVGIINPTFGSINRKDTTIITIEEKTDGYFINAAVNYKPSVAFWIIFCILIFTWVLWLLPIIFFIYQKKMVKTAITEVFNRTKNEFFDSKKDNSIGEDDKFTKLEKIGTLRDKGIISQEEFEKQKKEILDK